MASVYGGMDPIFSGMPGFEVFGALSPKRRSYLEDEARRTQGVIDDVMSGTYGQLEGLDRVAVTPGEREQVLGLRSRLGIIEKLTASGNPALTQMGLEEFSKLNDDIDGLGTQLTSSGIARQQAAADAQEKTMIGAEKIRGEMFDELMPLQVALDSFNAITDVTEIESPFALTAAAYKTVMLLQQGTGSRISDADLKAAESGITTWAGWLEQQLAAGASGKGFTAEARNGLLAVLDPLAKVAENQAAQTIARYGAIAEARPYPKPIVFAGLDESLYKRSAWEPSPVMTEEEQREAQNTIEAAVQQSSDRTGRALASSVTGFLNGYLFGPRDRALAELESGAVQLTPEAQAELESIGGVPGLKILLGDRFRGSRVGGRIER